MSIEESNRCPYEQIPNDGIFVLNPMFRLRNERDHVLLYGNTDIGTFYLHRTEGILAALCNGKMSVNDIIASTVCFAEGNNDLDRLLLTEMFVKRFLFTMGHPANERKGIESKQSVFSSDAPVLRLDQAQKLFGKFLNAAPNYDPVSFLTYQGKRSDPQNIAPHRHRVPDSLYWHLTSVCSTDCRYCYLKRRNTKILSYDRMFALIDEASSEGVFSLLPSGGDILLYPFLIDFLSALSSHKFLPVTICTKSFLEREFALQLSKQNSVWEIQFSIDTDDQEIAQLLVGVPEYPKKIFTSIENALLAGLRVAVKSVITPHNVFTVPRLYRKLKNMGVSAIRLATYVRSGFHHADDLFMNEQCYQWLEGELAKLRAEFPEDYINVQNGSPVLSPQTKESRCERWQYRNRCTAGRTSMMICSDGKVIPCEQMPETEEYFCGDLTKQSIMEVWNGDKLKEMTYGMSREKFKGQPCYDCEEREECHNVMGYCIRDLASHYGNIYQPPPNCYRHDLPFIRQT